MSRESLYHRGEACTDTRACRQVPVQLCVRVFATARALSKLGTVDQWIRVENTRGLRKVAATNCDTSSCRDSSSSETRLAHSDPAHYHTLPLAAPIL